MTILVTGAAGFIGSNFCHWLINNTDNLVVGVDNFFGGYPDNMPKHERYIFKCEDVRSDSMAAIFQEYKPSIVYHMAAYASEGRSGHIPRFIHENNTIGTTNIITQCVNYDAKLVFISSVAVYSGTPPYSEGTIPAPIDPYGLSKLTSEKEIEIAEMIHGLEWSVIRLRNVYGQRQSLFDPSRNLMGILFYRMFNKLPLVIFGDGSNRRNFTYIEDILYPMYMARKYNKQVFNLGSEKSYSISEVVDMFREVTGYDYVTHTEPRHEVKEAVCSAEKSKQMLDYVDKTGVYEGLRNMYQWAKKQPMRALQEPPPLEITKNTHSSLL